MCTTSYVVVNSAREPRPPSLGVSFFDGSFSRPKTPGSRYPALAASTSTPKYPPTRTRSSQSDTPTVLELLRIERVKSTRTQIGSTARRLPRAKVRFEHVVRQIERQIENVNTTTTIVRAFVVVIARGYGKTARTRKTFTTIPFVLCVRTR